MAAPLPVGAVIKTGYAAFSKAPFLFVGFTLIGGGINLASQFIQDQASKSIQDGAGFGIGWLFIFLLGLSINVFASLWMNLGLFRGAWRALNGEIPIIKDFVRWDFRAIRRLLWMAILLLVINLIVLITAALAGGLASLIRLELFFVPLFAGSLVLVYLAVTQMFHVPIVVAQGDGAMQAFRHGRKVVDPQFWRLLGFGLLMILITLAGLLLCGIGILVAAPVVVCCLVAAYQHLFNRDDCTGFLADVRHG